MTSAPHVLDLIDDGLATDADRRLADVFDAHASNTWHRLSLRMEVRPAGFCLVCGERSGDMDECDSCSIAHDSLMRRAEDI